MPGLYGPHKVYSPGEVLTAANLNATDQNHITNQTPQMTDDFSLDLTQKRTQIDPMSGLATSLSGELAQMRYVLAKLGQKEFWDEVAVHPSLGLLGYKSGFGVTTDVGDPNNDILVAIGTARSDDNQDDIVLAAPLIKRLDAVWVVGTNQGMLDGGSKVANTWYYIYVIKRPDTGLVDILASTSHTAPTMPTNYTKKQLIYAIQTDVSNNIKQFVIIKNWTMWKNPVKDQDVTSLSTGRTLYTIASPLNFRCRAMLNLYISNTNDWRVYVCSPDVDDEAPSLTVEPFVSMLAPAGGNTDWGGQFLCDTNTASQIAARSSHATTTFRASCLGWEHPF